MADVQLEHGHVKVANRLYEAIVDANFTATQLKIIIVVIRLTYGWNRKAVTLSHADLAELCRLRANGGGFRAALKELTDEGIVLYERGDGAHVSTFAIQKDFTQWGKFTVHPTRLSALWDKRRPTSNIVPVPTAKGALAETPPGALTEAPSDEPLDTEGALAGTPTVPLERHPRCPSTGTPTGPNCDTPPHLQGRKDSERHRKTKLNAKALSPVAGATRPKKAGKKPTNGPAFDLAKYIDAKREYVPDSNPPGKRWGASFKSLEVKYGADETLRRWKVCLDVAGPVFASPEELRNNWTIYDSEDAAIAARRPKRPATAPGAINTAEEMADYVRARVLLTLARRHNLLSYNGNRTEYLTRYERLCADPESGPTIRADLATVKFSNGLNESMSEHFIVKEIASRLKAGREMAKPQQPAKVPA